MRNEFLDEATPRALEEAAARNHREWFRRGALAGGGWVRETLEALWTSEGTICFPEFDDESAGPALDTIIADYVRERRNGGGCWSLDPPRPADLEIRLLARGFQPGWQPCWMANDLSLLGPAPPLPPGVTIEADVETPLREVPELPYAYLDDSLRAVARRFPGCVHRVVAREDGQIIGHAVAFVPPGPGAAAGLYNVGVVPSARRRGIGGALVHAVCAWARTQGCRWATLNGTGRAMYERVGFRHVGDGRTWWLMRIDALVADPPTPERIALAEAIGRGDVAALNGLEGPNLVAPLANGMSLLELAVHAQKPESARWLIDRGAALDPLSAWDLGWRDEAARLLKEAPEQVNRRYGDWGTTLLHIAAERGDLDLARLALSAGPDLTIQDSAFKGTPAGWARHFGRTELLTLLEGEPHA